MKRLNLKISRRERLYLAAGGVALFAGLVVWPALRAAAGFRAGQLELLRGEIALLEDLRALVADSAAIELENSLLREALRETGDLLFPPAGNPVMQQAMVVKLLGELGPDLELEVTPARSSARDSPGQMNVSVRGRGRYPEILKFLYRMESHRPLIIVDSVGLSVPAPRVQAGDKAGRTAARTEPAKPARPGQAVEERGKDPRMLFRLGIQIHSHGGEEGGA